MCYTHTYNMVNNPKAKVTQAEQHHGPTAWKTKPTQHQPCTYSSMGTPTKYCNKKRQKGDRKTCLEKLLWYCCTYCNSNKKNHQRDNKQYRKMRPPHEKLKIPNCKSRLFDCLCTILLHMYSNNITPYHYTIIHIIILLYIRMIRYHTSTVTGARAVLYPDPGLVISIDEIKPRRLSNTALASAWTPSGSAGALTRTLGGSR